MYFYYYFFEFFVEEFQFNLTLSSSKIYGTVDADYSPVLVVKRVYTSAYNKIGIYSSLSSADWISCKWTTTSRKTTEPKREQTFRIKMIEIKYLDFFL